MYSDKLDLVPQPSETERFPSVPRSAIFACVFQRCSDVSPSVRAAALRCLADITADQRGGVEGVVQQILSQEVPARGEEAKCAAVGSHEGRRRNTITTRRPEELRA